MAKRGSNIYKRKDGRYEGRVTVGYDENNKIKYKYIYAYLGGMKYTALTKQKINELILMLLLNGNLDCKNRLSPINGKLDGKSGLSPKTVRDIITVLKAISSYAHTEYDLENVCENIKLPKSENKKLQVLSHDERRILEQYLRTNLNITNVCILLCLYTGIRIGELCSLQWRDIELESANISISKTIQRISVTKSKTGNVKTNKVINSPKTKLVVSSPKTKSSIRKVPVPQFMIKILENFKSLSHIYLLSNKENPIEPRTMQYRFKKVLNSCKMRNVNFHTLRHTYATMCIENGFDAKTLSEILGHSDVSITLNRYVHSSEKMQKYYVNQLEFIS